MVQEQWRQLLKNPVAAALRSSTSALCAGSCIDRTACIRGLAGSAQGIHKRAALVIVVQR